LQHPSLWWLLPLCHPLPLRNMRMHLPSWCKQQHHLVSHSQRPQHCRHHAAAAALTQLLTLLASPPHPPLQRLWHHTFAVARRPQTQAISCAAATVLASTPPNHQASLHLLASQKFAALAKQEEAGAVPSHSQLLLPLCCPLHSPQVRLSNFWEDSRSFSPNAATPRVSLESHLVLLQTHGTSFLQRIDGQNPVESPEYPAPHYLTPTMTSASPKALAPSRDQCAGMTSHRNSRLRSLQRFCLEYLNHHVS